MRGHSSIDDGGGSILTEDLNLTVFVVNGFGFDPADLADDGFVVILSTFESSEERAQWVGDNLHNDEAD